MPALGLAHKLDVGAKRLVDGVTDPTLSSGVFYASAANTLKGPMVNQADFLPDLANPSFQDHANEAIHRFIASNDSRLAPHRLVPQTQMKLLIAEVATPPIRFAWRRPWR